MKSAFIYIFGFATGVLVYDTTLERVPMSQPSPMARYCTERDGNDRQLAATMVSSAAGTRSVHECYYR